VQTKKTIESQNQSQIDTYEEKGPVGMGPWTSHIWRSDPRHLGFMLARYKFCAKMLAGKSAAIEVGCGDAFGTQVVLQTVGSVHALDFEPLVVEAAEARLEGEQSQRLTFAAMDLTKSVPKGSFDAAYSLDVIEHVPQESEDLFMTNLCKSLQPHAVCIIGTPNIEASQFASEASMEGHINLKSADTLKELMSRYFHNVFVFSMNDEVVHTGYSPMAHYLLVMGAGVK
jgi:2-polyprenyl-3-methyl-5-hydroxy-6-metoxy-1,4-benzoquinol methylase